MLLTLTIAFLVLPAFTYFAGRFDKNQAAYHRGRHDGANEERSRANARIIAAKLEACRKGRLAERAVHFQN